LKSARYHRKMEGIITARSSGVCRAWLTKGGGKRGGKLGQLFAALKGQGGGTNKYRGGTGVFIIGKNLEELSRSR